MIRAHARAGLGKARRAAEASLIYLRSMRSRYSCPVCGRRVDRFEPLSSYYEENKRLYGNPYVSAHCETLNAEFYACPICRASDRVRLYALYIAEQLAHLQAGAQIDLLDIAPSPSLRALLSRDPRVRYRSADLYMDGVDDVVDITDMRTYRSGLFDAFVCSHVLEHVADDRKALSELFRVLRPGGWGILMVPINLAITAIDEDPSVTDPAERWRRFGQNDHVRLYSKQGFIDRVADARFSLKQLGVDFFGHEAFQKHGISSTSVLYVVERP